MPQAQPMPGVRGEVCVEPVGSEKAAHSGVYLRCRHVRAQGFQAGDKLIRPEIVSVHILKK